MATGLNFINHFTLVNAPAGSGKTTAISFSIKKLLRDSDRKILCITYTNRATEQLKLKIDDDRVDINTIHSYISIMMQPIFEKRNIIDFYGDIFASDIERILNSQETRDIERLDEYRKRKEISSEIKLTKEIVLRNIHKIYYGESQYSSPLYGRLSHDDLLIFSKETFKQFPKINKIISQKYSYVFIDEYQDTRSEILELFYSATLSTSTKLVLLGDEMQQIYNDRVEGFQKILDNEFSKDTSLNKNWRSQENIVNVLNNIYFDTSYKQNYVKKGEEKPRIHLCNDINKVEIQDNVMQLVLYNAELFDQIGAGELYRAFNERYQFSHKYSSKQILTDMTMENPDELMKIFIFITDIVELFNQNKYGELIKKTKSRHVNEKIWRINRHSDKLKIQLLLTNLSDKLREDVSLGDLLGYVRENKFIETFHFDEVMNNINENENFKEKILRVKYIEFKSCYYECSKQSISTQHAVKGEGHTSIALKISDGSSKPNVQMYLFLKLWSMDLFKYQDLKNLNSDIQVTKEDYTKLIEVSISSASIFRTKVEDMNRFIYTIIDKLEKHQGLYELVFKKVFDSYLNSSNITNFKKCLTLINKIDGVILAYKLFYVGCSRAMEKLDVYISIDKIEDFETDFITKMETVGFLVENHT